MIARTQQDFDKDNSVERQHFIPRNIHRFAVDKQLDGDEPAGKSRSNQPTLPDIYMSLIKQGVELVKSGRAMPLFYYTGKPQGARSVRIRFPDDVNNDLLEIQKTTSQQFTFYNMPADAHRALVEIQDKMKRGDIVKRKYCLDLSSIAVVLMETAIRILHQPSEVVAQ